jgi:hypothetical protein
MVTIHSLKMGFTDGHRIKTDTRSGGETPIIFKLRTRCKRMVSQNDVIQTYMSAIIINKRRQKSNNYSYFLRSKEKQLGTV